MKAGGALDIAFDVDNAALNRGIRPQVVQRFKASGIPIAGHQLWWG